MSDSRPPLLIAALGFAQLPPQTPALRTIHGWLDSWSGLRWIAQAMRADHHELSLARTDQQWTATFWYVGPTQLPAAAPSGLATMPTPWLAVQWAAWEVVRRGL